MPGLPSGWEADYDGKRWFYTYLPSGHVQYHFPSEGDEFPDFIDVFSPAPALAPEERLASQQQVKRSGGEIRGSQGLDPSKDTGMMASGIGPVSSVWEDVEEAASYQPESFMFLGPGSHNDVSPVGGEEDEAAKREVVGSRKGANSGDNATAIEQGDRTSVSGPSLESSPSISKKSPPTQFIISEAVSLAASPAQVTREPSMERPTIEAPAVHMIDSREVPVELPVPVSDPVGNIAEMPTCETAKAYIETNPDPVEIADTSVPAPIKPSVPASAERRALPGQVQPTTTTSQEYLTPGDATGSPALSMVSIESGEVNVATELKYKPFKPGQVQTTRPRSDSQEAKAYQASLQREKSLMMGLGNRPEPQTSGTPSFLTKPGSRTESVSPIPAPDCRVPPSTTGTPVSSIHSLHTAPIHSPTAPEGEPSSGVVKYPSVLRPARGRAQSQSTVEESLPRTALTSSASPPHPALRPGPAAPTSDTAGRHVAEAVLRPGPPIPPKVSLPTSTPEGGPSSTAPQTFEPYTPKEGPTTRKSVPNRTRDPSATSPPVDPLAQNRRHSSVSPFDPIRLRSGSILSLGPQSPPGGMQKAASAMPLAQSLSQTSLFTPSPQSLTPGSSGQSNTVSPISGHSSQKQRGSGSEQGSYFTAADARRHSFAGQLIHRSQSQIQSPPVPPQSPDNGAKSNRMSMQASPGAGNLLNSIREHDETQAPGSRGQEAMNRHSMASYGPFKPGQGARVPMSSQQLQQATAANRMPQQMPSRPRAESTPYPCDEDLRQRPLNVQRPPQGSMPPSASMPPAKSIPPNTQNPVVHPAAQGRPTSFQGPGQRQYQHPPHAHTWNQQGSAPPKDKENKFKKWFKGSKSSGPAEPDIPSALPHASRSAWPGNLSIPQAPRPPAHNENTVPWSPGQVNSGFFSQNQRQSFQQPPASGAGNQVSAGPNVLQKPRPGQGQQSGYQPVTQDMASGRRHNGSGFGGPPTGQQWPMYGSAVDL